MLVENKNIAQKEKGIFRKWFSDDYLDLIVWYRETDNEVIGFQLCYDKNNKEHAFTWQKKHGFTHNSIDPGKSILSNQTPILTANGIFPRDNLLTEFNNRSKNMEKELIHLIIEKISEFH